MKEEFKESKNLKASCSMKPKIKSHSHYNNYLVQINTFTTMVSSMIKENLKERVDLFHAVNSLIFIQE